MDILEEKIVTDSEAKKIMAKRAEETELKFEQQNAFETLSKFNTVDEKSANEMRDELFKISKLRENNIASIINFLPQDKEDLRAVLSKDFSNLTEDEANLVLDTVKKFA